MLHVFRVRIGIVEVVHRIQPSQTYVCNLRNAVIRVQGLFEPQIGLAGVGTDELQNELGTKTNSI